MAPTSRCPWVGMDDVTSSAELGAGGSVPSMAGTGGWLSATGLLGFWSGRCTSSRFACKLVMLGLSEQESFNDDMAAVMDEIGERIFSADVLSTAAILGLVSLAIGKW